MGRFWVSAAGVVPIVAGILVGVSTAITAKAASPDTTATTVNTATTAAAVTAVRKPPVVVKKSFDPNHLPTPGPPISDSEIAVCVSSTSCSAVFETQTLSQRKNVGGGVEATVKLPAVKVTVELTTTVWLPIEAPAWVKEHEETHRKITERVYASAEKAALAAGRKVAGRTFVGNGTTVAAAEKDAVHKAQEILMAAYMERTGDVWARVNEIFDDITKHGTRSAPGAKDPIDAKAAMERAFSQYEKEGAGTRPGK